MNEKGKQNLRGASQNPRQDSRQDERAGGSGSFSAQRVGKLKDVFLKGLLGQEELMDLAQSFAQSLVSARVQVKHHQLRLLLDLAIRVKQSHKGRLDEELSPASRGRLAVMRPRLAYMAARERGLAALQKEIDILLQEKNAFRTGADLDRLYEFFAAVVAFHRYEEASRSGS